MPTYNHGGNTGFAAANAAMASQFARNGGIMGMFRKPEEDKQREMQLMIAKIMAENELAKQKLANTGQLDVTKEGNKGQVEGIKTHGVEQRLTAEQAAKAGISAQQLAHVNAMLQENQKSANEITKNREASTDRKGEVTHITDNNIRLGNSSTDNTIRANRDTQAGGVLGRAGVLQDPKTENEKVFSGATADPLIGKVRGAALGDIQDQNLTSKIRGTPEFGNAAQAGMLASALKPVFDNATKTISAGPGTRVTAPPSGMAIPPAPSQWPTAAMGALSSQSVEPGGIDALTGMQRPDKIVAGQQFPTTVDMSNMPAPEMGVQAAPPAAPATGASLPDPFTPPANSLMSMMGTPPPTGMPFRNPQMDPKMSAIIQYLKQLRDQAGAAYMGQPQ